MMPKWEKEYRVSNDISADFIQDVSASLIVENVWNYSYPGE